MYAATYVKVTYAMLCDSHSVTHALQLIEYALMYTLYQSFTLTEIRF